MRNKFKLKSKIYREMIIIEQQYNLIVNEDSYFLQLVIRNENNSVIIKEPVKITDSTVKRNIRKYIDLIEKSIKCHDKYGRRNAFVALYKTLKIDDSINLSVKI